MLKILELFLGRQRMAVVKNFIDIAENIAETNYGKSWGPDYTSWHVIEYDSISGEKYWTGTYQTGLCKMHSRWSRGTRLGVIML